MRYIESRQKPIQKSSGSALFSPLASAVDRWPVGLLIGGLELLGFDSWPSHYKSSHCKCGIDSKRSLCLCALILLVVAGLIAFLSVSYVGFKRQLRWNLVCSCTRRCYRFQMLATLHSQPSYFQTISNHLPGFISELLNHSLTLGLIILLLRRNPSDLSGLRPPTACLIFSITTRWNES